MYNSTIYTIGHSDHTWEEFSALLRQHGIQVVVDARSNPVSRFAPFASKRTLPTLLGQEGKRYVFLGESLGGKPSNITLYNQNDKPDYEKIRSLEFFKKGIEELLRLVEDSKVVIMCAEEDPSKCHRRLLIEPALVRLGVEVLHIRGDGSVQRSQSLGSQKAYQKQFQDKLL